MVGDVNKLVIREQLWPGRVLTHLIIVTQAGGATGDCPDPTSAALIIKLKLPIITRDRRVFLSQSTFLLLCLTEIQLE